VASFGGVEVRETSLPGGAALRLSLPLGLRAEPVEALPRLEVGGLPGARVALRMGFVGEDALRVRVACVEAPSDRWAPGLEEVVLGLATSLARKAASEDVAIERLDIAPIKAIESRFEQGFSGAGTRAGGRVALEGKHVLGFEGEAQGAVLCTVFCEEARVGERCGAIVERSEIFPLVGPPPPSFFVRAVLYAAEQPLHAAAAFGLVGLALVAVLLARRPRPRA